MNDNIKAGDGGYSIGTKEKYDEFVKGRNRSLGTTRILQLAEQAGAETWSRAPMRAVTGLAFTDENLEKFAELIVKECALTAGLMEHEGRRGIGAQILEHFGVE